jgi:hypothetical protein
MSYTIIKNDGSCGICGYIWQVLRAMWHNPNSSYYIDFTQRCQYKDDTITKTSNVWEYYFKQPHSDDYPASSEIVSVIDRIIDVPESEFRDVFMINPTKEDIAARRHEYFNIIKKYIRLQPHVENKINNFVENNFKGKKVLGVHFRGTDHPDKKEITEYLQVIKNKAALYDIIFCASDEYSRYNMLKVVFGDKVVTYDSIKSDDDKPLHYKESISKYKIGEDVIVEAFLLSKTDFIFCCGNSNVNYLSRAINPTLESQVL